MGNLRYQTYLNKNVSDCHGKTIVITGANSGIGFLAARALAYKGAHIVMACRSLKRAEDARRALCEAVSDASIDILQIDQASFKSIDQFTNELRDKYQKIDAFVFNAGIFHPTKDAKTQENYPLTIGTNYLGTFYLFERLLPYFETMSNVNVVCVGSLANSRYKIENMEKYFTSNKVTLFRQYALSKMFMMSNHYSYMNKPDSNIHYSMMHPGVASTNIVSGSSNSFPGWFSKIARGFMTAFMNHPEKSALGIVLLVANQGMHNQYLKPRGLFAISGYPVSRKVPKILKKNADLIHEKTHQFFKQKGRL